MGIPPVALFLGPQGFGLQQLDERGQRAAHDQNRQKHAQRADKNGVSILFPGLHGA
jgi:hypothetical protein